jgi:hypothetical protein
MSKNTKKVIQGPTGTGTGIVLCAVLALGLTAAVASPVQAQDTFSPLLLPGLGSLVPGR